MQFREAVFFRCIFIVFLGDGSARVKIARMCSSGRDELCKSCLNYFGERTAIGFLSAALTGGVLTVVESRRDIFVLILADQGMIF